MAVADNFDKRNNNGVTFEEAMEIVGSGSFQNRLAIVGGVIILSSYYALGVITFVLPSLHCDLQLNYQDRGNLASISFVGLIISCHTWGFLSDTLGRKYILIRCLIVDALLYVFTSIAPNFYSIFILRGLNGIASCGGVVSVYAYVGEFQTEKYRYRALMISSFIASFGYIILPLQAWLIIPEKWHFELYAGLTFKSWRLYYLVCGLPSFISAIILLFYPESPKFLLAKGENKKVISILEEMYQTNHGKDCKPFPINEIKINAEERVGKLDGNKNKVLAVLQLLWNQTVPLLKNPYKFNFALICIALFICFFCNNGLHVWLPEALNQIDSYRNNTGKDEGTFCNLIDYANNHATEKSAVQIILNNSKSKITNIAAAQVSNNDSICKDETDIIVYIGYGICGIVILVVFTIIAAVIKYVNKKYILMLLSAIFLLVEVSLKVPNFLLLVFVKAGSVLILTTAILSIVNSVVVDLFPTNIRAMAGCLTLLASRLGSVVTHETSGFLIESNCSMLVWIYIILAAICFLAVSFLPSLPANNLPSMTSSSTKVNEQEERVKEI